MPLKNDKIYCVNHPDLPMVLSNEGDDSLVHISDIAIKKPDGYYVQPRSTGYNLYSCKKCGYSEIYLIPFELDQLNR